MTPYLHLVNRAVRKAWLSGIDPITKKDFSHRKHWVEDRILMLSRYFTIDIAAYAVMSNHYHIVCRVDRAKAKCLTDLEVVQRRHKLYKGNVLSQKYERGELLDLVEMDILKIKISIWRDRLYDVSWFMRCLNEPIAKMANKEDGCTGRFWEGRFKSQSLLDEQAVLTCMAYVDLNPIRAGIANPPESSDFTSIKSRIKSKKSYKKSKKTSSGLMPFSGKKEFAINKPFIPFSLNDYLQLLDDTGRVIRDDKKGFISDYNSPILQRLNIELDNWLHLSKHFLANFQSIVGIKTHIIDKLKDFHLSKALGLSNAGFLFRKK